ncbi:hypothetical protein HA50_29355 [Pantoea cypripedii]|uniref:Uncharacterized protein n=1 Tax=Pantoea cypripedii TaxID=55209 RepID=A0A1X1EGJ1_PANCY|nr:hypothetical protein HA50_29355 [Pantoea cypripedii]
MPDARHTQINLQLILELYFFKIKCFMLFKNFSSFIRMNDFNLGKNRWALFKQNLEPCAQLSYFLHML